MIGSGRAALNAAVFGSDCCHGFKVVLAIVNTPRAYSPAALDRCTGLDSLAPTPECTPAPDADGDGFGATNNCNNPDGAIDCDDTNGLVYPGAEEVCEEAGQDAVDNNCDGQIDEGLTLPWYLDGDGAGYGTSDATLESCVQPEGYVSLAGDCSDELLEVNPEAEESCNGMDDNCNGQIDEGLPTVMGYLDSDGGGYGRESEEVPLEQCVGLDG